MKTVQGKKLRPIRECHKCPRYGKGDNYCWEKCKGPADNSHKGINFVMTDGMTASGEYIDDNLNDNDAVEKIDKDTSFVYFDEESGETENANDKVTKDLSAPTEQALSIILANLFSLSDNQLCIFKHFLFGEDYAQIGRSIPNPLTKEAVHANLVRMAKSHPFVAKVMHGMKIKGIGKAKMRDVENLEFCLTD